MAASLLDKVGSVHRRALWIERVRCVALPLILGMVVVAVAVMVDHLLRWPWPVRCVLLIAGLWSCIHVTRRAVLRGWIGAPSLPSVAIRLERVEPRLAGHLASAVDFERTRLPDANMLARQAVEHAHMLWDSIQPGRHLRTGRAAGPALVCLIVLLSWIGAAAWQPHTCIVGLRRTLTPWTSDQWPARVAIKVDATTAFIARGDSVPIRVRISRGDTSGLQVHARCVITSPAGHVTERFLELIRQADGSYERPVLAEGDRMHIELTAQDADPQILDLSVVTPPSIEAGTLVVQPPSYAAGDQPSVTLSWQGTSVPDVGAMLAGSSVSVQLQLAAPAPLQRSADGNPDPLWLQRVLRATGVGGVQASVPTIQSLDDQHWILSWIAADSMDLTVQPVDAQGVAAPGALQLSLRVTPDREPAVSVTDPASDETITSQAMVPFTIEASDDLSLASIAWQVDRQQRSGEPGPVRLAGAQQPCDARNQALKDSLPVATWQVRSGDVLLLRGLANDHCEVQGTSRAPVSSEARRLQVVDRETFERQVRQQVASLRQTVARLEMAQQDIVKNTDAASASRAQAGLTDRMRQADTSMAGMMRRLLQNQLGDLPLTDTLREAGRLGVQAEAHSTSAQEALQRAASGDATGMEQAQGRQRQSIESLQAMMELLDRDDDAAAAQRRADRLAESISRLRKDLQTAGASSAGKAPEDMSTTERQAMQEQSARQRAAADEARAMLDDLRARADRVQGKDRAQARTLQQAAEQGEKGQASRHLDEAADRTDRNQATAADESMQAAADAVERVRESLREDRRARTEDLRRRLASLEESLRSLIRSAEAITRDTIAMDDKASGVESIATACIQLARNTTSASQQAQEAGQGTRPVARVIERSAERFDAAVTALRAQPVAASVAIDAMRRGTDLLHDALKQVQEIQRKEDERAQDRARTDLSKVYMELANQVRSVREATVKTMPAPGARLDRRGAATQREQAERLQGTLQTFQQGPKASELVVAAETFKAAHQRIEPDLVDGVAALRETRADARTIRRLDLAADTLESLSIALRDPEQGDDPFADGKQESQPGGGGEGGADEGKKGLPPIAELRLVRQMQFQVNQLTRTLDAARLAGQAVDPEIAELGVMQDEVRRLGEDWIRRMNERNSKPEIPRPTTTEAPPTDAFMAPRPQAAPSPSQSSPATEPPTTPAPAAPASTPPKTLDELLGIEGGSAGDAAAQAQRDRKLAKSLKEEDLRDLAKLATESMDLATTLVGDKKDSGIGTQRVQAEALASLDALIDAATRFQKQQSKGSGSRGSQRKDKSEQSQANQSEGAAPSGESSEPSGSKQASASDQRSRDGNRGDQVEPPPPEDAAVAGGVLEEGRSEWGRLPQRIREIMSQARRDRVSTIYQQATEAYYRRMAEERNP